MSWFELKLVQVSATYILTNERRFFVFFFCTIGVDASEFVDFIGLFMKFMKFIGLMKIQNRNIFTKQLNISR